MQQMKNLTHIFMMNYQDSTKKSPSAYSRRTSVDIGECPVMISFLWDFLMDTEPETSFVIINQGKSPSWYAHEWICTSRLNIYYIYIYISDGLIPISDGFLNRSDVFIRRLAFKTMQKSPICHHKTRRSASHHRQTSIWSGLSLVVGLYPGWIDRFLTSPHNRVSFDWTTQFSCGSTQMSPKLNLNISTHWRFLSASNFLNVTVLRLRVCVCVCVCVCVLGEEGGGCHYLQGWV